MCFGKNRKGRKLVWTKRLFQKNTVWSFVQIAGEKVDYPRIPMVLLYAPDVVAAGS